MKKTGILTFHYSNNYGGVLQTAALYNTVKNLGYDVEVIHYIPSNYTPVTKIKYLNLVKNEVKKILKGKTDFHRLAGIPKKISIIKKHGGNIDQKFSEFRTEAMRMSRQVDESSLPSLLSDYETVIVGSDQVWNPSQRTKPEYFLDYGEAFKGQKISYAADSTVKEIDEKLSDSLKKSLDEFNYISVRNEHSFEFVKSVTGKETDIVADPTLLADFQTNENGENGDYIFAYIIGKEISGTHSKAIDRIKKTTGDLPVYSIKIPDMQTEPSDFADKTMYDVGPQEWIDLIKNAKFIYTDSFHGVLFSLKYQKPFLAYYTEKMRATRFVDLGKRYQVDRYIVNSVEEIGEKGSVDTPPDYAGINLLLEEHRKYSLKRLEDALNGLCSVQ